MIAGRDCDGFDLATLRARYRSILQSNRLVGCSGEALPPALVWRVNDLGAYQRLRTAA